MYRIVLSSYFLLTQETVVPGNMTLLYVYFFAGSTFVASRVFLVLKF